LIETAGGRGQLYPMDAYYQLAFSSDSRNVADHWPPTEMRSDSKLAAKFLVLNWWKRKGSGTHLSVTETGRVKTKTMF